MRYVTLFLVVVIGALLFVSFVFLSFAVGSQYYYLKLGIIEYPKGHSCLYARGIIKPLRGNNVDFNSK